MQTLLMSTGKGCETIFGLVTTTLNFMVGEAMNTRDGDY